jgi:ribosomal protein L7/L12
VHGRNPKAYEDSTLISGENEMPGEAIELARHGQLIEAIKLLREETGLSLKDAKDAIEFQLANSHIKSKIGGKENMHGTVELPRKAIVALESGSLIEAIKHTREVTGLGLKDAKQTVENYLDRNPIIKSRFKVAASAEFKRVASKVIRVLIVLGLVAIGYILVNGKTP